MAAMKEQRRQDFGGVLVGQMKQLWTIARRKGGVWDLPWKIIAGQVVLLDQRSR